MKNAQHTIFDFVQLFCPQLPEGFIPSQNTLDRPFQNHLNPDLRSSFLLSFLSPPTAQPLPHLTHTYLLLQKETHIRTSHRPQPRQLSFLYLNLFTSPPSPLHIQRTSLSAPTGFRLRRQNARYRAKRSASMTEVQGYEICQT